jgi:hypothetical protein
VLQHLGELAGEGVELLVGQLDAGQLGHVRDVVTGDVGHQGAIV